MFVRNPVGVFGAGEIEVSPVTAVHIAAPPLTNAALSGNYMQDAMKMKLKIQCYKNTSTAFWFWNMQCLYLFQEVKAFWKTYLRRSVLTLLQIDQCMGNTEIHHWMFLTSHRCFPSSIHTSPLYTIWLSPVKMSYDLQFGILILVIPLEGCRNSWIISIQYFTKPSKDYNDFSHY